MDTDERYLTIKSRLETLTNEEISRIIDNKDRLCVDLLNYDILNDTYCPLAIALNLHNTIKDPNNSKIMIEIEKRFIPVNIVKGLKGKFYTTDRKSDIINLCHEILNDRLCLLK